MELVSHIVTKFCIALIEVIDFAILIRVLLSWIPVDEEGRLEAFLFAITEPVILPMRILLDRFESMKTIPIDIPLLLTAILLSVLSSILSAHG